MPYLSYDLCRKSTKWHLPHLLRDYNCVSRDITSFSSVPNVYRQHIKTYYEGIAYRLWEICISASANGVADVKMVGVGYP